MVIKTWISSDSAHEINSMLRYKFADSIISIYKTYDELIGCLGDDFDLLIISYQIFDEEFKNHLRIIAEEIKKGVRIIVLNQSGSEMSFDEFGYLLGIGIEDYSREPKLKASTLFEMIEKPKKALVDFSMSKSEKTSETVIVEKIVEVEKIIKIKQGGVITFFGVTGTGISTAAMYFAKELAETLKEVGDKHSKVLLLEMNYINPKLRHYLQVQEPRCSIEHMTLSLSDAKSGTINIQALDYSSQPINELDNFYFIDSLYGVKEEQFVEPFHLKYLLDHFKNVFDFIVITGDLNLKDKFTAAAISESSHMFLSLDMNYANLDRLKRLIETNDKILTKTTPIINMYRDTKKLQPLQYADALGFKEYFVLPYEDEIRDLSINLANNSKLAFAKSPEYKSAIVKLVELYVTKPKKEVKKKLFNFSKGEKR